MKAKLFSRLGAGQKVGLGAAALLAIGFVGGAGAVSLTRHTVVMAPTVATAVSRLSATQGVVTIKGRVAEVYGDRFVVQDGTGRALVATGRDGATGLAVGAPIMVQGRFDGGQLRAQYLVDASGKVEEVGPPHPHGRDGPRRPHHGEAGPPPLGREAPLPPEDPDAPPPPPAAQAEPVPQTAGAGVAPPPSAAAHD
jgi:hypothetical protein